MTNLNIYFSSICNLDCTYCHIKEQQINNKDIVDNILNKTFQKHILKNIDKNTTTITLCGTEVALNGKLFADLVGPILQNRPTIQYINLYTSGSIPIFNNIIIPLNYIVHQLKQRLVLTIYICLDGPEFIQDRHKGIGNYKITTENLNSLCIKTATLMEHSKFLRIKIYNHSTLIGPDLISRPMSWKKSMEELNLLYEKLNSQTFICKLDNIPYLEIMGDYTKQDGLNLCKWKGHIRLINGCLMKINSSKTIDCFGNLYDCYLLKNMITINLEARRLDFNKKVKALKQSQEILQNLDESKLWKVCNDMHCWGLCGNFISESIIKLLGNGIV